MLAALVVAPGTALAQGTAGATVRTAGTAGSDGLDRDDRYALVSMLSGMAGGMATGWNLMGMQSRSSAPMARWTGATAGATSLALGISRIGDDSEAARTLALVNLAVGTLNAGTAWMAHRQARVQIRLWVPSEPDGFDGLETVQVRAFGVSGSIPF